MCLFAQDGQQLAFEFNRIDQSAARVLLAMACIQLGQGVLAPGLGIAAYQGVGIGIQKQGLDVNAPAAHLLANGNVADVVLFGSFLVWAVLCFINAKKRDRAEGKVYPQGQTLPTIVTVVIGLVVYGAFVMGLHRWLIGVPVF